MKLLIYFLFLGTISYSFGQKGFVLISRAEKQITKGNYEKALRLLNKADTMNYGFCGNTWIEAQSKITENRIKIYDVKKDYLKAANELNEISFNNTQNIDSLKMYYFIKCFDKKTLKREIDSCINSISSFENLNLEKGILFNVKFSDNPFRISRSTYDLIMKDIYYEPDKNKSKLECFINSIHSQPFYKLLL